MAVAIGSQYLLESRWVLACGTTTQLAKERFEITGKLDRMRQGRGSPGILGDTS